MWNTRACLFLRHNPQTANINKRKMAEILLSHPKCCEANPVTHQALLQWVSLYDWYQPRRG
jgi:hypothetical protein